jgi:hypothetical protein
METAPARPTGLTARAPSSEIASNVAARHRALGKEGRLQVRLQILPKPARVVERHCGAANIILGTLLSVFHIAEPYKEIKEGVEFAVKNGRLIRRARDAANWVVVKVRGGLTTA